MQLNEIMVATQLFPVEHCVKVKLLVFRLRCLAHRLRAFGFEAFVNTYEPRELVMLACFMPPPQYLVLLAEAFKRGDETLRAWLNEHCPESLPVETARG